MRTIRRGELCDWCGYQSPDLLTATIDDANGHPHRMCQGCLTHVGKAISPTTQMIKMVTTAFAQWVAAEMGLVVRHVE